MKYVLYRFPNAVRHPENSDPELYGIFKFPVKGQVVGVEFGSSIGEVTDELIHDVNDELSKRTQMSGNDLCAFRRDVRSGSSYQ